MIKLKKLIKEGYAWERDENGALPTLESSTAKHAENVKEASTNELDLVKNAIGKISQADDTPYREGGVIEAIEDGYYAMADNLPNMINDIAKAIKIHAKALPADMQESKALRDELKIYNDIQALLDKSTFGSLL